MYLIHASTSSYQADKARIAALTPEKWQAVLDAVDESYKLPSFDDLTKDGAWWSFDGLLTLPEAKLLTDATGTLQMSRVRGLFSEADPREVARDIGRAETVSVQVSVPGGVALTNIASVAYLEDCCTDKLQGCLDNGWRILAVCPPNDARRPTYIIGHTDRGATA